jgi:hypothetical protein
MIHVQVGKNTIKDVLLDGGFRVDIITKHHSSKLGLPKPKPTSYNLKMVNQTIIKLVG